mmetsp:Transcript_34590/g.76013  ORF Transcript_34590/g.76013 Transcript_34590/m.76013 type:complete len:207 (+) Transcript_34590:1403-2023(+)
MHCGRRPDRRDGSSSLSLGRSLYCPHSACLSRIYLSSALSSVELPILPAQAIYSGGCGSDEAVYTHRPRLLPFPLASFQSHFLPCLLGTAFVAARESGRELGSGDDVRGGLGVFVWACVDGSACVRVREAALAPAALCLFLHTWYRTLVLRDLHFGNTQCRNDLRLQLHACPDDNSGRSVVRLMQSWLHSWLSLCPAPAKNRRSLF